MVNYSFRDICQEIEGMYSAYYDKYGDWIGEPVWDDFDAKLKITRGETAMKYLNENRGKFTREERTSLEIRINKIEEDKLAEKAFEIVVG